ncbi:MAG: substrate-binding domain-containing protein, partial [Pseudomonadota bacterium]
IAGLEQTDASKAMMQNSGIPIVQIMDVDGEPIDCMVGISHRRAGRKMAQAIIKAGYQNIGFMGTKMPRDHRARKRFEGFTQALAKDGIEIQDREFYSGGSALAKGREMTIAMLDRTPELDFLYYSNDMIAAGGLLHLLHNGIDVPGQIGLAGFNKVELIEGLPKIPATMDACRYDIGQIAAQIIAGRNNLGPLPDGITMDGGSVELTPKVAFGNTLKR